MAATGERLDDLLDSRRIARGDDLAHAVGGAELLLHGLVDRRQEDNLAISCLSHGLHCLEITDLHGRGGREDVGSLDELLAYSFLSHEMR